MKKILATCEDFSFQIFTYLFHLQLILFKQIIRTLQIFIKMLLYNIIK